MVLIRYVTTSGDKVEALRREVDPSRVTIRWKNIELPEGQLSDLRAVAEHKVHAAMMRIHPPYAVHDSGFFLAAYPDFPGVYTKHVVQTLGNAGILRAISRQIRACSFRDCLAYCDGERTWFFEAEVPGSVAMIERGKLRPGHRSPLWRLFIPRGQHKTLAEMNDAELAKWRLGRPSAEREFAQWLAAQGA